MSDTPICNQCFEEAGDFSRSSLVIPLTIGRDLERKLNESNADRLRLREALHLATDECLWRSDSSIPLSTEQSQRLYDKAVNALTTQPPPVVAKADADALADALREIINNDDGLSPELDGARKTIETYRAKYKEGA